MAPCSSSRSASVVGLAIGRGSAWLVSLGSRRHWIVPGGRRLAALAAALSSFTLAVALDGNGFIAAFVAGIAFGAGWTTVVDVERTDELPELMGEVLALVVWFLFGAVLVPVAVRLVRRLGPRLRPAEPHRGPLHPGCHLADRVGARPADSPLHGLVRPEALRRSCSRCWQSRSSARPGDVAPAVAAVAFTVLLSVVLHGVSAGPLALLYARSEQDHDEPGDAPGRDAPRGRGSEARVHLHRMRRTEVNGPASTASPQVGQPGRETRPGQPR